MTVRAEADSVRVVACAGEFDQDTVGLLQATCDREATSAKLLVIDVKNVTFADSSFLNTLIRLRNAHPLAVAGPLPDQLHRLLDLTGARHRFEMCDEQVG
ncbi:STAS domain-containing protein [Streptomyces sp. NRRL S-378]|uniref:STAS domain-containing protein n=1 Tax=Streptomyces sp. NRRL S-378 TaxID=1463904 RepID=UPI000691E70B|nr:STAS domain-containing protein [Streptomyces sp. NRRL S-378]